MEFFNHRRLLQEPNITTLPFPPCSTYPLKSPEYSNGGSLLPHPIAKSPSQNQNVPPLVIIMVAVVGTCFLLVSYYAIIVKYCSYSRRSSETQDNNSHEDFFDENHGPVLDHPIWYINTVGLEQSIINSIAMFKYKKGDGLVEGTECLVCLGEFDEDESLRLLPKCSHAFHLPCIDTWLRSHTSCPLCRAPILSTASRSSNLNSSEPPEEPQTIESSGSGGGGMGRDTNEVVPSPVVNEDLPSQVPNDLQRLDEKQIKWMRRSISMGVSPASLIGRSSSKGRTFDKLAVSMKRSFSSGGKLLLSRSDRRDRNSILPL